MKKEETDNGHNQTSIGSLTKENSTQLIAYAVNQSDIRKYITHHISERMNKNYIQTSENIKNH